MPSRYRCSHLLVLIAFCNFAMAGTSDDNSFQVRFKTGVASMMIVPVTIDGSGLYDFMFDTGAVRTVIDRKLALELNLPHAKDANFVTARGSAVVSVVHTDALSLAGATVRGLDLAAVDRVADSPVKVRGSLGEDFLRNFDLLIDNSRHLIQFESGAGMLTDMLTGEHVPFSSRGVYRGELTHNRLVVVGRVPELGDKSLTLLLDSGTNYVVLFAALNMPVNVSEERGYSAIGTFGPNRELSFKKQAVRALLLGDTSLVHLRVVIPTGGSSMDEDGFLPVSIFNAVFISHSGGFVIFNPVDKTTLAKRLP
jgi:predicted aspartyl protease